MPRVKRGPKRKNRRSKTLALAKGYYGTKSKSYRMAKLQVEKSLVYAYRDRKVKKRDFRGLWIVRINAAARENEICYSRLMDGLEKAGNEINRELLADLAAYGRAPSRHDRAAADRADLPPHGVFHRRRARDRERPPQLRAPEFPARPPRARFAGQLLRGSEGEVAASAAHPHVPRADPGA